MLVRECLHRRRAHLICACVGKLYLSQKENRSVCVALSREKRSLPFSPRYRFSTRR